MFDRSVSGHLLKAVSTNTLATGGISWDPSTNEIVFDGVGALSAPDSADWTPEADYMVELPGVKFSDNNVRRFLICHWRGTTGQRSWELEYNGSGSIVVLLSTNGNDVALTLTGSFTPTVGVAYDIAFNRIGSTWRIFAGASVGLLPMLDSGTLAGSLNNSDHQLLIGSGLPSGANGLQSSNQFIGRMKNVPRITKGSGRGGNDDGYTFPETIWPTN